MTTQGHPKLFYCPQCGDQTNTLYQGYCEECCESGQLALDQHNAGHDHWNNMTDGQREEAIRRAYR